MMRQLLTLLLIAFTCGFINAQSEMIIEPGDPGIIEQTIFGDTTETGERNDPDRVYVLRRATPYLTAQSIEWSDYDIRIKAEDGDGARPLIVFSPGDGGEGISQMFRLNSGANLYLDGIHLSCRDVLGNPITRALRMNGDNGTVELNDVVIGEAGQSIIRLNADSLKVYVRNSIFNRIGEPTNPNNGRMFDNRGHPIDTLLIENSVIYAVTSRHYRHSSGGRLINGIFNQNTFWGSGQHAFTFGLVDNLTMTNNIIANPVFLGRTQNGAEYVATIDTFIDGETNINISFNNIYTEQAFDDALPDVNVEGDSIFSVMDTLFGPILSDVVANSASATTNISEELEFTDAPNMPADFIAVAGDTLDDAGALPGAGDWDFSDLSPDDVYSQLGGGSVERYSEFHDFSYPESSQSYTAGDAGQPIGADLSETGTNTDDDFFVTDNILFYPNPVREELFIQNLDKARISTVAIYDLTGRMLMRQQVDEINARFNLGNLPLGTYVLTVVDNGGKVSARKIVKH